MKKNDVVRAEIVDITNLGFGVAKVEGRVIFVSGTVPGDECEIKIIKDGTSFLVGRAEKFIKRSELRSDHRCHNARCQSCAYKCLSYDHELRLKEEGVRQIFKKAGLPEVKVMPIVGSPETAGYRNKAQYPITRDKDGNYIIGFYAPKSHRVTEAADCPLAPEIFPEILEALRIFFGKYDLSVYNEATGEGLLRHIYIRRGEMSSEVLLTLVINGDTIPRSEELVSHMTERFPSLVGILLNINKEQTNVILGESFITLYGRDYIFDTLGGVALKITAPSFYQVNRGAAELLYAKAKEHAKPTKDDLLLDLYCGAGSIGLSMADEAGEIIGIEIVESAVECATFNAEINHIHNASFYAGDASEAKRILEPAEAKRGEKIMPSIVVFDPPRGGTTKELISHVSSLNPQRIVYISCNPATLARDMVAFKEYGYVGNEVTPFDLFPLTGHVESVVCLSKQSFRMAVQDDAAQILSLYESAKSGEFCVWNDSYPTITEITHDIETNNLYVMTDGEKTIGAISVVPENELDGFDCWSCKYSREIARVVIDKAYRGRGLSFEMVQRIESILRKKGYEAIHLSVAKSNIPAYKTYVKAGFAVVAEAQMYGNDYYLMEKVIDTKF